MSLPAVLAAMALFAVIGPSGAVPAGLVRGAGLFGAVDLSAGGADPEAVGARGHQSRLHAKRSPHDMEILAERLLSGGIKKSTGGAQVYWALHLLHTHMMFHSCLHCTQGEKMAIVAATPLDASDAQDVGEITGRGRGKRTRLATRGDH